MVRIPITVEAFEAIASTLLLVAPVAVEAELDADGQRQVWLDPSSLIARLRFLRESGIDTAASRPAALSWCLPRPAPTKPSPLGGMRFSLTTRSGPSRRRE